MDRNVRQPVACYMLRKERKESMGTKKIDKPSVRLKEGDRKRLNEIKEKYHLDSDSEAIKLSINQLCVRESQTVLPTLCNLCSMFNLMMDQYDFTEKDRAYVEGELNRVWKQMK